MCWVADVTPGGARIFSITQDIESTREHRVGLALAGLEPRNQVRVIYYEGSSVYGSAP